MTGQVLKKLIDSIAEEVKEIKAPHIFTTFRRRMRICGFVVMPSCRIKRSANLMKPKDINYPKSKLCLRAVTPARQYWII